MLMNKWIILLSVALAWGVGGPVNASDQPAKPAPAKSAPVKPAKVPASQAMLPKDMYSQDQLAAIDRIKLTLAEVVPKTTEQWQIKFSGNQEQLSIWENMANAYTAYVSKNDKLTLEQKKETFMVLLFRSMVPDEEVLARARLKTLTKDDAKKIMQAYTAKPAPFISDGHPVSPADKQ